MRVFFTFLLSVFILCPLTSSVPQREFRANWVATVGNIDWPKTKITSTGNQTQIAKQKAELLVILDSLQSANMNAALLQIRPMSDALYPSEIVCWSAYLTGTRGQEPGYDPLAFAIEEAHKRGLELHGWMNPYRYTNTSTKHAGDDYMKVQHMDWLLCFSSGDTILNPGLPAVRKHIAEVTKEVIVNYPDIDGIVWDDYFYISSISNEDDDAFRDYNPGSLSIKNWRRDNVNKTVREVYDSIQVINPGIRFGISPRGIWSISSAAANKYGVSLPLGITGADNYNSIYCDGLAWLSDGSIDYISPQLYWATTPAAQAYGVLAPWWQSIANKYGRHFYSSQALYKEWGQSETGLQIEINRSVNNNSPGSIYYNTSNFSSKNYAPYLRENYYNTKILPPAISWKNQYVTSVSNVENDGSRLTWQSSMDDGSYVIYAVPSQFDGSLITDFTYMLTRTWAKENYFDLSAYSALQNTHTFAVSSVDRFENQSMPVYAQVASSSPYYQTTPFKLFTSGMELHVILEQAELVNIYSLSGAVVYSGRIDRELTIALQQGVYIVKIGTFVRKIVLTR